MPALSFDVDGLLSAAGQYDAAAADAQHAVGTLAATGLDATALGGTPFAQALGSALGGLREQHLDAAAAVTLALGAVATRLRSVGGLGVTVVDDTAASAS